MNPFIIIAITILSGITGISLGDELKITYPDNILKAFGDQQPLRIEAVRKNGQIEIRLVNISKKHAIITKQVLTTSSHYETKDGTKTAKSMAVASFFPMEFSNHVVLMPHKKGEKNRFSSWKIWEIPEGHKTYPIYLFDLNLSGYFPTIDKYVTFSISGRLNLKTIADKPAAENKPEIDPESVWKDPEKTK